MKLDEKIELKFELKFEFKFKFHKTISQNYHKFLIDPNMIKVDYETEVATKKMAVLVLVKLSSLSDDLKKHCLINLKSMGFLFLL